MSGSFTGFSEDDIRKLNNTNPEQLRELPNKGAPKLKAAKRTNTNNSQGISTNVTTNNDELRSRILKEKIEKSVIEPIPESAKLCKPPTSSVDKSNTQSSAHNKQAVVLTSTQYTENLKGIIKSLPNEIESESQNVAAQVETVNKSDIITTNEDIKNLVPEKKLDLDEFQARQKLIEEQNRKRKELLVKALAVKTKQTQEEAQKLNEIKNEFKKLDALLSNDVKILRQQIEIASLDYMEAQKRYFRVEKEFLEAKVNLHQKLERKEMLTEHLCAIIEKNEERKAEKLNELLLKLNLKTDIEEDISKPDVTQCNYNETKGNEVQSTNDNTERKNATNAD